MALSRRLLVLIALLCLGAVFAAPSMAAPPPGWGGPRGAGSCGGFPFTLGSAHFLVHYFSDNTETTCDALKAITETQAGDVLGYMEEAYQEEVVNLGYPAPPSDGALGGDGRYDIYIIHEVPNVAGEAAPDTAGTTSTGSINLDAKTGINPEVETHEFFHLVQFGMWIPPVADDYWLLEETAEWMSARINNYGDRYISDLGPLDMALDCKDPIGTDKCNLTDGYANGGYSRWPFWYLTANLYSPSFVKEVFLHGAANPSETAVQALSGALAAHSATLTDTFTTWTNLEMSGGYGLDVLDQVKPKTWAAISTGISSRTLPTINVPVDHLATRLVEFDRGDGSGGGSCFAAKLTLTVTIPPGVASKPSFYWNGLNSAVVPLTINGNTATTTQPWDTCTWTGNQAYLNLPNPDTDPTHNGELFKVVAKIDVDTATSAQAAAPPDPMKVTGNVIAVPSTVAPTVKAFGPELLRLSASSPVVRLILEASGEGKIRASLGGTALGTADLRPGNNDVRFDLPKSLLPKLRVSSAAASNVLTLTPLSTSGTVTGTPVTRKVLLPTVKTVAKTTVAKKHTVKKHTVKKR